MKLLTARADGSTGVWIDTPRGYASLEETATALDEPLLKGIRDIGALLNAGREAWKAIERSAPVLDQANITRRSLNMLTIAPPILHPDKIICVGHNYLAHIEEGHQDIPTEPLLFSKCANTLIGDNQAIRYPPTTAALDYEGELALVISQRAFSVSEDDAMNYIAGFTVFNDVSARDLQHGVSQWFWGKSLDTFGPVGPFVVTPDSVGPYADLRIKTRVNGELRQDASCADMIFSPARLIAFISSGITLEPGDLIATGTPSGVGSGFEPPRFLSIGDVVEISITKVGTLRSHVIPW